MAFQAMIYQVSVTCLSDVGLIRQNNEDSWKLLNDEQFYAIADGMGGHQAGEVASHETVERLCALVHERNEFLQRDILQVQDILKTIIQEVNTAIYLIGHESSEHRGMGTTLCCIQLHSQGLIYAHVGDSRIYRLRNGELEQLTHDHSLLCELIDQGQLDEQQAQDFSYKNIITKAIGTESYVDPSVSHCSIEPGDMILLCTDGLSDLVSQSEIQDVMLTHSEEEIAKVLVRRAKQHGGNDNITVILVKIKSRHEAHLS